MIPIEFEESHLKLGENQEEYLTLHAHRDSDGVVTGCWKLSLKERLKLLLTGRLWVQLMTFNNPVQPHKPSVSKPELNNG